ncbi:hypothetical protein CDAR_202161 [Caerostris darwini]|uniref:Uncharacterized protein n=1 Tax=Caerostris darwini TaxID=1538125 RepID=A0AAV4RK26_9ARAC|nr:hypothetical protein CDAR_202161 [Caerostris darwini]
MDVGNGSESTLNQLGELSWHIDDRGRCEQGVRQPLVESQMRCKTSPSPTTGMGVVGVRGCQAVCFADRSVSSPPSEPPSWMRRDWEGGGC